MYEQPIQLITNRKISENPPPTARTKFKLGKNGKYLLFGKQENMEVESICFLQFL